MANFTSLEGHLYVKDVKEAFAFYGKALGMVAVPHHGYDILTLDGKHFFHIFEAAPTAQDIPIPFWTNADYFPSANPSIIV
ncbi:MAG: hypothetical protein FWC78_03920 [Defluviitaleaceae bacterium]|nr:hypothetical protein [Defluviitaleaceae bacterium]